MGAVKRDCGGFFGSTLRLLVGYFVRLKFVSKFPEEFLIWLRESSYTAKLTTKKKIQWFRVLGSQKIKELKKKKCEPTSRILI